MKPRSAFTLVELLVVVAILGLLASLLAPSLRRAGVLGRRGVCLARLGNFQRGMHAHTAAHDGEYLPCLNRQVQIALRPKLGETGEGAVDWVARARRQGIEGESAECPDRPGSYQWESWFPQMIIGYQYFGGIRTWKNPWGTFESRSPVRVARAKPDWVLAADCMMKIDRTWGGGRDTAYGHMPVHRGSDPWPEGGNQVHVDGSAAWVAFEETVFVHSWGGWNRIAYIHQRDLGDFDPPADARARP